MNLDEATALLDASNPRHKDLCDLLRMYTDKNMVMFAKKDQNLVEVVEDFCNRNFCPVVDKFLHLVIGCHGHQLIRAELYRYHVAFPLAKRWHSFSIEELDAHADAYSMGGLGYHFSAMGETYGETRGPVVMKSYEPDRYDRDLFKFYDHDRRISRL